MTLLVVSCDL